MEGIPKTRDVDNGGQEPAAWVGCQGATVLCRVQTCCRQPLHSLGASFSSSLPLIDVGAHGPFAHQSHESHQLCLFYSRTEETYAYAYRGRLYES